MKPRELGIGAAGPGGVGACATARTLLLAAAVVYVAMICALFLFAPEGAPPALDLALTGYGPDDVAAYFARLDRPAVLHAVGPFRWLDYLFPPLLALGLAALFRCLGGRGGAALAGAVLAVIYGLADLSENVLIDSMIRGWPNLPDNATVIRAALATRIKFAALGFALLALGLVWWKRRREGEPS